MSFKPHRDSRDDLLHHRLLMSPPPILVWWVRILQSFYWTGFYLFSFSPQSISAYNLKFLWWASFSTNLFMILIVFSNPIPDLSRAQWNTQALHQSLLPQAPSILPYGASAIGAVSMISGKQFTSLPKWRIFDGVLYRRLTRLLCFLISPGPNSWAPSSHV